MSGMDYDEFSAWYLKDIENVAAGEAMYEKRDIAYMAWCAGKAKAVSDNARLQSELDEYRFSGIHTCNPNCQRPACKMRRENERLQSLTTEQAAEIERLRKFMKDRGLECWITKAIID